MKTDFKIVIELLETGEFLVDLRKFKKSGEEDVLTSVDFVTIKRLLKQADRTARKNLKEAKHG